MGEGAAQLRPFTALTEKEKASDSQDCSLNYFAFLGVAGLPGYCV